MRKGTNEQVLPGLDILRCKVSNLTRLTEMQVTGLKRRVSVGGIGTERRAQREICRFVPSLNCRFSTAGGYRQYKETQYNPVPY